MRRTVIGPLRIVERRNQFEVRRGRAVPSKHDSYLDAEDAAIRRWLHKSHNDVMAPTSGGSGGGGYRLGPRTPVEGDSPQPIVNNQLSYWNLSPTFGTKIPPAFVLGREVSLANSSLVDNPAVAPRFNASYSRSVEAGAIPARSRHCKARPPS
jgi:hypothetical protein